MTLGLGAQLRDGGVQFAVRARDAESVTLCLFDGERETRVPMQRSDDLFMTFVDGLKAGQRYGYRAAGVWAPERGLHFDPAKLLVDPYAQELDRRFAYHEALAMRGKDTAQLVPKAIVSAPFEEVSRAPARFSLGGLIYELNVKSFTLRHPDVPPQMRGTIAALAHPAIIAHFKRLRVSAIELMPIVAWIDERHLPPLGLHNALGYNPVVPMALDPGLAPGGVAELRETVAALHANGIGVILDLVFNHTGESDLLGPTLSLRGLDNRCYSRAADGALINDTGTGNTLNSADPVVQAMILDTLRHFVRAAGADGFRFDLATVLARSPAFDPRAPLLAAIARDPLLADRVMIAEPWDVGPDGYQLGNFPDTWLEWNDRYRDDVRRFWRGDAGTAGLLATRLLGSSDIFHGERTRSVNFLATHDGFTLADVVTYAQRHNEANGEDNRDGQCENFSWNNGIEGPSDDPVIRNARMADVHALLATLFASRGTILLTAGDEFGRTQLGNNNAYAQDNAVTWLDWENRDRELEHYVVELANVRAHRQALADVRFSHDERWFDLAGSKMTPQTWESTETEGFELRFSERKNGGAFALRVDRRLKQVVFLDDGEVDETLP
ncbi:MAG TPA: glycogen debranching protein GlgX [Rhizomicrobium sp.]|jgi:glycogen operon protein